jgi:Txe/YoeB family toxin of Txe-Axe toxin-antitoxin module
MKILPLRSDLLEYLAIHKLTSKWKKITVLLVSNIKHPSLNTELLEPKWHGIYSFRVDRKYRALFFVKGDVIEVFQITNHYKK